MENSKVIRHLDPRRWEGVSVLDYKEEGQHFQSITRQVLFDGETDFPCQVRYFEIDEGGHSTLERHQHVHVVMIIRGRGRVLLNDRVEEVKEFDLVTIPPQNWHQFRATEGTPLGFLCLVNVERDRPVLPGEEDLEMLRADPDIAGFIRF
ncbi:MAG: cupin domain-containing protein [Firmicutes bacterium]|nr:cupin domain-containing protein [Bacillota bacterium]